MYPSIYEAAVADVAVKAALGPLPLRFYPFGNAPDGVALPYAVWRTITGAPENSLGDAPTMDSWLLQIDVYGKTATSARGVARALRDVAETHAYVVGWRGEDKDPDTKNYHYSFDVEWIQSR